MLLPSRSESLQHLHSAAQAIQPGQILQPLRRDQLCKASLQDCRDVLGQNLALQRGDKRLARVSVQVLAAPVVLFLQSPLHQHIKHSAGSGTGPWAMQDIMGAWTKRREWHAFHVQQIGPIGAPAEWALSDMSAKKADMDCISLQQSD